MILLSILFLSLVIITPGQHDQSNKIGCKWVNWKKKFDCDGSETTQYEDVGQEPIHTIEQDRMHTFLRFSDFVTPCTETMKQMSIGPGSTVQLFSTMGPEFHASIRRSVPVRHAFSMFEVDAILSEYGTAGVKFPPSCVPWPKWAKELSLAQVCERLLIRKRNETHAH